MDSAETGGEQESMLLRVAFLHYVICLGIFILLVVLWSSFDTSIFGFLSFFFYIGAGVYLNRKVLRNIIEWHPVYSTLANVSSAKLWTFLLWPIRYLILFIQLGINKML